MYKKMKKTLLLLLLTLLVAPLLLLHNCTGVPEGVTPVTVEKQKYIGKWHEIARLDHSFERGLTQVTATYSLLEDGGIKVLNKGFNKDKGEWKEVEGKAYFVDEDSVGHLKVSFFAPFYGSYVIFELDHANYQWAYITSYNKKYLWLLSRKETVSEQRKQHFLATAKKHGFNTDRLIFLDPTK